MEKLKGLTYEEAFKKLEDILDKLENEEVSLEEHLNLFQESVELHKYCNDILNKTENIIEVILEEENK